MKKTVLTFGAISGVIVSLIMLLTVPFHDQIGFDNGYIVGYTSMLAAFLLIYFGVRSYRDNVAGGSVNGSPIRSSPGRKSLALWMTRSGVTSISARSAVPRLRIARPNKCVPMLHGAAHLVAARRRSRTLSDGSRPGIIVIEQTARALFGLDGTPATMRCIALATRGKVPRPCVISAHRISTCYTRFSTRAQRATLAWVASSRRSGGPWSTSATERSRRLRL